MSDHGDVSYTINNTEGREGPAWRRSYATQAEAAEALRGEMGWGTIVLSESYSVGDSADAVSVYETQEDCDADQDGAYAPRIVETR